MAITWTEGLEPQRNTEFRSIAESIRRTINYLQGTVGYANPLETYITFLTGIYSINLVNGGILAVKKNILLDYLPKVTPKNGEIYLTDLVKISNDNNKSISYVLSKEEELLGINDRQELAKAENLLQKKLGIVYLKACLKQKNQKRLLLI